MSYVKYTAADGTVHLCHEDSPMLMHAKKNDNNDRVLSMAIQTNKTTKNNLKSFFK